MHRRVDSQAPQQRARHPRGQRPAAPPHRPIFVRDPGTLPASSSNSSDSTPRTSPGRTDGRPAHRQEHRSLRANADGSRRGYLQRLDSLPPFANNLVANKAVGRRPQDWEKVVWH